MLTSRSNNNCTDRWFDSPQAQTLSLALIEEVSRYDPCPMLLCNGMVQTTNHALAAIDHCNILMLAAAAGSMYFAHQLLSYH